MLNCIVFLSMSSADIRRFCNVFCTEFTFRNVETTFAMLQFYVFDILYAIWVISILPYSVQMSNRHYILETLNCNIANFASMLRNVDSMLQRYYKSCNSIFRNI